MTTQTTGEHIHFGGETFPVGTSEEIAATKKHVAAYQEGGLLKYPVYAGEGSDEVDTGRVQWIDSATAHE